MLDHVRKMQNRRRFRHVKTWYVGLVVGVECVGDPQLLLVLAPPQHLTFKKTSVGVKMKKKVKPLEIKPEHLRRRRRSVKNEKNKDRLKKLHVSQGVQNKIGMQRCGGRKMRSARQRSGSWKKKKKHDKPRKKRLLR
ncbi:unnamed protein product [Brassica oleracea var. botrytis]